MTKKQMLIHFLVQGMSRVGGKKLGECGPANRSSLLLLKTGVLYYHLKVEKLS